MSTRTIIELDHDFAAKIATIGDVMTVDLLAYLTSPNSVTADRLKAYGLHVVWRGGSGEGRVLEIGDAFETKVEIDVRDRTRASRANLPVDAAPTRRALAHAAE